MNTIQQAPRSILLVLLALAALGCGDGAPADLCRVAEPENPAAYVETMQAARGERDEYMRDSESSPVPLDSRPTWTGLQYYPVDASMRFAGPLIRAATGRRFEIVTTAGELRPCREVGYFLLDLGAGEEKLPVYELLDQAPDERGFFVPFTDATTADETYPAGRYLEVTETGRGQYLLDFNTVYNPSCAYGGVFQCPVAPDDSRLTAAVRAGERGWVDEFSEGQGR